MVVATQAEKAGSIFESELAVPEVRESILQKRNVWRVLQAEV